MRVSASARVIGARADALVDQHPEGRKTAASSDAPTSGLSGLVVIALSAIVATRWPLRGRHPLERLAGPGDGDAVTPAGCHETQDGACDSA